MDNIAKSTAEMMEWELRLFPALAEEWWIDKDGKQQFSRADWNPDKDISQAMQVAEHLREDGYNISINSSRYGWVVSVYDSNDNAFFGQAETLEEIPFAICSPCLEAKDAHDE